jgi:hypothetical protein
MATERSPPEGKHLITREPSSTKRYKQIAGKNQANSRQTIIDDPLHVIPIKSEATKKKGGAHSLLPFQVVGAGNVRL